MNHKYKGGTMEKRFSIIICAYNIEKYIQKAIKSVLTQTYGNYEIIVFNDGSTDKTLDKIQEYSNNSKIKIINSDVNIGLGAGRNVCMKEAEGEYIIYLDGDDTLYEKTTLEKIDNVLSRKNPDICYFGVQYVEYETGKTKIYLPNDENSCKKARILCDMHFAVSSKCWRREFLQKNNIEFIEKMYYEDMVYSIKCAILAEKLDYADFPIYNYVRNRKGSIMSTPTLKRCSDMYKMLSHVMELYEITPEEYKPYLLTFIKQETLSLPYKNKVILQSMNNKKMNPVFPKRNYEFNPDDEDIKV